MNLTVTLSDTLKWMNLDSEFYLNYCTSKTTHTFIYKKYANCLPNTMLYCRRVYICRLSITVDFQYFLCIFYWCHFLKKVPLPQWIKNKCLTNQSIKLVQSFKNGLTNLTNLYPVLLLPLKSTPMFHFN